MMAKGTLAIPHNNERVSAGSPCWARGEGLLLDRQWVTTKGRPPGVRPSASRCERGWWSRDRAAGGLALARQGDWGPPHASPRFPTARGRWRRLSSPVPIASPALKAGGGHLQTK